MAKNIPSSLRCRVRDQYVTTEIINFCKTDLCKIMEMLNVTDYAIGGSVAAFLYGVDLGRAPHDIDVIIPRGSLERIKNEIKNSIFFAEDVISSSCDPEWQTKHFAFRTIKSRAIDLIECPFDMECIQLGKMRIVTLDQIIKSKKMYHRPKDTEDLVKLEELYNKFYEPELNALALLKKKMEE